MSMHVDLKNIHPVPGGIRVPSITCTVRDVRYEFAMPSYQVSGAMIVQPVIETDHEANAARISFDQWRVVHDEMALQLPINFADMATAVQAAREFERDPGIDWASHPDEIHSWALVWLEHNRTRTGGDR